MISFCESEDGDDNTCGVPAIKDPDNIVETIVVNVGTDVSNNDQFVCSVNEYPDFSEAIDDTEHVRDEVCELPSDDLTPSPTDNLTPAPTHNPTPSPTPQPTSDPTPAPTDNPTPYPTENPTPKPTHSVCDLTYDLSLVIAISNGCYLSQDECATMRELLSDVVEKVYNEQHVDLNIVATGKSTSNSGS